MGIKLNHVIKRFGNFTALNDISLEVKRGELLALLGPSGSGKTTLLRVIAGLEKPDSGRILMENEDTAQKTVRERRVGFVFQHYALFRHMTIFDNIAFGLRVMPRSKRPSREEIRNRVESLLKLIQLEWLADRYPSQLSGGQRQRVALARALAVEPKVLLLDEPFGALDAKVRMELRRWLRNLHHELQVTSVFVTHDQEEALELADRIVVMNNGCIVQTGSPEEVYEHPATPFVYNFLGKVNLFRGRVGAGKFYIGNMTLDIADQTDEDPVRATGYIRPHLVDIDKTSQGSSGIRATVCHINRAGPLVRIELCTSWGDPFLAEITQERFQELDLRLHDQVFIKPREIKIYSEQPE